MRAREDLTNVQFPILNSHPKGEAAACVRAVLIEAEAIRQSSLFSARMSRSNSGEKYLAIRHPLRMGIEHWSDPRSDSGQRILPRYVCASPYRFRIGIVLTPGGAGMVSR